MVSRRAEPTLPGVEQTPVQGGGGRALPVRSRVRGWLAALARPFGREAGCPVAGAWTSGVRSAVGAARAVGRWAGVQWTLLACGGGCVGDLPTGQARARADASSAEARPAVRPVTRPRAEEGPLTRARARAEAGMSTAEYAVGTIAACGFAALLFKIVTSAEVRSMLSALIQKALKLAG
ncbi:DUF4244 domain-containing protein [Planotetraspora phitsanulokensis]|uniref:DUF4244 domain-containing protein n=1 Tax=Planotetraspora phitsanulokensis TaxID=575192 RepID=UPI0019518C32|nr:DUF4244 domain-containing protein [Planotetraspora phitsanulokensis]